MRTDWHRFWFDPAEPQRLGCYRAVFFGSFYVLTLIQTDLREHAHFPPSFFQPRSFFAWLSLSPPSDHVIDWLVTAFEWAVILSALGCLTRLATITSFGLGLYLIGLQFNYGYLHWAHAIAPIVIGVLALSPCGDAVSIDAIIRTRLTGKTVQPSGQYHWPIQLVRTIFVTVFLAAGLAKLRTSGLAWVTSDTLRHYLLENQYIFYADATTAWSRPIADWIIDHPTGCRVLAGLTLILELSTPAALLSIRARWVLIPALFLFQVGNALLLYQNFFFTYLGLYAFWITWPVTNTSPSPSSSAQAPGQRA